MFSSKVVPFYIPTNSTQGFPVLHIFGNICCLLSFVFLITAFLTGMRWYLMALLCISLMISDIKLLFMFLLAIYTTSLEKSIFKSFSDFSIRLFAFYYWAIGVLYICWILILYMVCKYCLLFHGLSIYSVDCALWCIEVLNLI